VTGSRLRATAVAGLALVALAAGAGPALLPAERAFALSARALDPTAIEVRFQVADGYYLYRDKLKFIVQPPASAGAASMPPGKVIEDEFFGKVATFRGEVAIRVPLKGAKPGSTITLVTDSQGCADAGVCYPPQRQSMVLAVPAAGAGPGPLVHAVPPKKVWFQ
jgi:thiol:disulfide interchange protein DsbD